MRKSYSKQIYLAKSSENDLEADAIYKSFCPDMVNEMLTNNIDDIMTPMNESLVGVYMLVDISGFTKLSCKLCDMGSAGIDKLRRTINKIFGAIIPKIYAYGGDVLSFAGDALICFFKLDSKSTSHYIIGQALQCAGKVSEVHEGDIHMHIGLSFGKINVAVIGGHDNIWSYLVNGECVSEISSCVDDAGPNEIVITSTLFSLIKDHNIMMSWNEVGAHGNYEVCGLHDVDMTMFKSYDDNLILTPSSFSRHFVPPLIQNAVADDLLISLSEIRSITTMFIKVDSYSQGEFNHRVMDLQTFFVVICEVMTEYGGMLRQFLIDDKGCVVIILWGVQSHCYPNDCFLALQAAVEMNKRLKSLNHKISVGISYGTAFCGIVGTHQRREYVAMGKHVNLAARLMCKAKGKIFISDAVFCKITDSDMRRLYRTHVMEMMHFKGFDAPIGIYSYDPFEFINSVVDSSELKSTQVYRFIIMQDGVKEIMDCVKGHVASMAREEDKVPAKLIVINGAKHSGKSSVARSLDDDIPNSIFIDIHASDGVSEYSPLVKIFRSVYDKYDMLDVPAQKNLIRTILKQTFVNDAFNDLYHKRFKVIKKLLQITWDFNYDSTLEPKSNEKTALGDDVCATFKEERFDSSHEENGSSTPFMIKCEYSSDELDLIKGSNSYNFDEPETMDMQTRTYSYREGTLVLFISSIINRHQISLITFDNVHQMHAKSLNYMKFILTNIYNIIVLFTVTIIQIKKKILSFEEYYEIMCEKSSLEARHIEMLYCIHNTMSSALTEASVTSQTVSSFGQDSNTEISVTQQSPKNEKTFFFSATFVSILSKSPHINISMGPFSPKSESQRSSTVTPSVSPSSLFAQSKRDISNKAINHYDLIGNIYDAMDICQVFEIKRISLKVFVKLLNKIFNQVKIPKDTLKLMYEMGSGNFLMLWNIIGYIKKFEFAINETLTVPMFIESILGSLNVKQNVILRYSSVLGEEFEAKVLLDVVPSHLAAHVESSLEILMSIGFIYMLKEKEGLYSFQNTVIREQVYNFIPRSDAKAMHSEVVLAIEATEMQMRPEYCALLCYHCALANDLQAKKTIIYVIETIAIKYSQKKYSDVLPFMKYASELHPNKQDTIKLIKYCRLTLDEVTLLIRDFQSKHVKDVNDDKSCNDMQSEGVEFMMPQASKKLCHDLDVLEDELQKLLQSFLNIEKEFNYTTKVYRFFFPTSYEKRASGSRGQKGGESANGNRLIRNDIASSVAV